jgi:AraC-like DNA-binding protein
MFLKIKPKGWTALYVDAYWFYKNDTDLNYQFPVLPDGCVDIVFDLRNGFQEPSVVGCMTQSIMVDSFRNHVLAGIRFKPGCASPFLNIPLIDITDQMISLHLIRKAKPGIEDGLDKPASPYRLFEKFEEYLSTLFNGKIYDLTAPRAAELITRSRGQKTVDQIADSLNVSRRHLERRFTEYIGIPPKLFSKIIRFQNARTILKSKQHGTLADIAMEAGYYDQSHFYKDFKDFTGVYPHFK